MSDDPETNASVRNLLVTRHRIIVDDKIIYEGEDWGEAATTFLRNAQRLDVARVMHQIDKKQVSLYGDPRTFWS